MNDHIEMLHVPAHTIQYETIQKNIHSFCLWAQTIILYQTTGIASLSELYENSSSPKADPEGSC